MNEPNTDENEFLPPYTDADAPKAQERAEFRITDEAAANWYLRKLANIEAEKARVQSQAAAIVAQLDADAEGLRYCFEGQLQNFVRQELARRGNRRKSLTFLQGTAQFRTVPAGIKITDPKDALDFARRHFPGAIKTAETLDAAQYRELAETAAQNGERLPGVETTPQRETFSVKF